MKNPTVRTTILTRVTEELLGELLLGLTREDLRAVAVAYNIPRGRDKYHTISNMLLQRDKLRGNVRLCIEAPHGA